MKVRFLTSANNRKRNNKILNKILDFGDEASAQTVEAIAAHGKFSSGELTDYMTRIIEISDYVAVLLDDAAYIFKKVKK